MSTRSVFLWNLFLALAWAAGTGRFTPANLLIGFGIGYFVLLLMNPAGGAALYFRKARKILALAGFLAVEVVRANVRVAVEVITPGRRLRPGVIAIPLDARDDGEIVALMTLLTLTPDSLSLDVSPDRRLLYVHAMFADDPDVLRARIKREFERRVLEISR